jgi:hypothetical protein
MTCSRTPAQVPMNGLDSCKARGSRSSSERHGGLLVMALAYYSDLSGFDEPISANTKTTITKLSLK